MIIIVALLIIRLFWTLYWTFEFHKSRVVTWLAEQLLASEERLFSLELVG
jgi:hypothetical protein